MKMKLSLILFLLILNSFLLESQDTFSIVAVDSSTGEVGSAGASCVDLNDFPGFSDDFLGELFPGVGVINTQAWYQSSNQINARARMNMGETPGQIIQWLVSNDVSNQPQLRQYGIAAIINGSPQTAAHTGSSTDDYKNHILGPDYAIQGNILLGQEVLDAMESGFLNSGGGLACKLMAALQGAKMVGADTRCSLNGTSSLFAFIKVAQPNDAFGNPSFLQSVRTSNGAGLEPVDALQILFDNTYNCSVLSIKEQANSNSNFVIYPNPVEDILIVKNKNKDSEFYKLEVINLTGSIIYQCSFRYNLKIKVSEFQKGVYIIRITNKSFSTFSKVIKR